MSNQLRQAAVYVVLSPNDMCPVCNMPFTGEQEVCLIKAGLTEYIVHATCLDRVSEALVAGDSKEAIDYSEGFDDLYEVVEKMDDGMRVLRESMTVCKGCGASVVEDAIKTCVKCGSLGCSECLTVKEGLYVCKRCNQ